MTAETDFTRANQVANAAGFFDAMRAMLPRQFKAEAEQHVERLHDIAGQLAGDRVHEIYPPDDSEPAEVAA